MEEINILVLILFIFDALKYVFNTYSFIVIMGIKVTLKKKEIFFVILGKGKKKE